MALEADEAFCLGLRRQHTLLNLPTISKWIFLKNKKNTEKGAHAKQTKLQFTESWSISEHESQTLSWRRRLLNIIDAVQNRIKNVF